MPLRVSGFRRLEARLRRLANAGARIAPREVRTRRPAFRGRLARDVARQARRNLRRVLR